MRSSEMFQLDIIIRFVFIVFLVAFNVLMFRSFNKALQKCRTTVEASIINTASNFVATVTVSIPYVFTFFQS